MTGDAVSFIVVALAAVSLAVTREPEVHAPGERGRARDGIAFLFGDPLVGFDGRRRRLRVAPLHVGVDPADVVYVEDVLGIQDIGIGVVHSAWSLGRSSARTSSPVGSPSRAWRPPRSSGVAVQGLGKLLAPFWLVFGFMVVAYFVGGSVTV